jgi:hypothetical protein
MKIGRSFESRRAKECQHLTSRATNSSVEERKNVEKERKPKLIYAHFGDLKAISFVSSLHSFKMGNKTMTMEARVHPAIPSAWWWSGKVGVEGAGDWPLSIAIIHQFHDTDERMAKDMGFERSHRLRVVCRGSSYRRTDGVMEIVSALGNEAHLRDFDLFPIENGLNIVASQLIESFVMDHSAG